jgi:hypothetical protein
LQKIGQKMKHTPNWGQIFAVDPERPCQLVLFAAKVNKNLHLAPTFFDEQLVC